MAGQVQKTNRITKVNNGFVVDRISFAKLLLAVDRGRELSFDMRQVGNFSYEVVPTNPACVEYFTRKIK